MYAMMHVAIHDALNAIDRRSRPYAFDAHVAPGTSTAAAVAAAARGVLVAAISQIPFPPRACRRASPALKPTMLPRSQLFRTAFRRLMGSRLDETAAAAILALRASDGSDTPLQDLGYLQGTRPGEYRFTPGFNFVFAPGWGVTPFVLNHAAQFRANKPYGVTSKKYAADFNEVKAMVVTA